MKTFVLYAAASALLLASAISPATHAVQGVVLATGLTDFTTWNRLGDATAQNFTLGTASPTACLN